MNLTMLLDMAADGFGDRPLVGRSADALSASGLRRAAWRGAHVIREAGADAVLYTAGNGPEFQVALFAASYAGVPLVPLNYRLGQEQLDQLRANHPGALVIGDGDDAMTGLTWLAVTTQGPAEPIEAPFTDEPAIIIYTSGTTSTPKGVLLRHANLVSYVLSSIDFDASGGEQTALMSVPPYHIAAVANVITSVYSGRRLIALDRFMPHEWLELVRSENVTHALVVPTMLAKILDSGGNLALPSLKSLAYGGAPAPAAVVRRALETWPEVDFTNAYGLTETSSTVTVLTPEDHRACSTSEDPFVRVRLGSVGRPLPAIDIQIRDDEGAVLQFGMRGRIFVRGDQVSAEYAGQGRAVDQQGFFDTRDEGYLDEEGYLFVGGRTDDTIIRGGENIAPAEIETVMLRHPAVGDVAVVGLPDQEWGQRIVAAVVLRPDQEASPSDLQAFALRSLRSSKTPERIEIWDELPRTETGKLVRREVVRTYLDKAASGAVKKVASDDER